MPSLKRFSVVIASAVLLPFVIAATPGDVASEATPLQTLYMVKQLFPQAKTVGLMWQQSDVNSGELIPKMNRAGAAIGVEIVVEDVEQLKDIPDQFRDLVQKYHIQALWVYGGSDLLSGSIARDYLIKNTTVSGVGLFAPNADWVSQGACATVLSNGADARLVVNQRTINALGIKVPEKYVPITQFLATN